MSTIFTKKSLVSLLVLAFTTIAFTPKTYAASDSALLQQIADNTYNLLKSFNQFALAWINPDDSTDTADLQKDFTDFMNDIWNTKTYQLQAQSTLVPSLFPNNTVPANINDLYYPTTLGYPYSSGQTSDLNALKASVENYTKYVSGLNINHAPPIPVESGMGSKKPQDKQRYIDFYNSIIAVQTFNSYIFSEAFANYYKEDPLATNTIRQDLESKATSPSWFTQVASNASLSIIIRQSLMFLSQIYILNLQQLETQKQLVAAQSMTNTLLILSNQSNEATLYRNAKEGSSGF